MSERTWNSEIEEYLGKEIVQPFYQKENFGGEKLGKKESNGKLDYELDFRFITQMAERMKSNKKNGKYAKWNWKKPMNPLELRDAIFRHTIEIMEGRFEDDGREFGHLEALATNAMMLNYQLKKENEKKLVGSLQ